MKTSIHSGNYLRFDEVGSKPRTKIWDVVAGDEIVVGQVMWFGRWTQYAFFPASDMVFEKTCLRDIADFCVSQTSLQRKRAHKKRSTSMPGFGYGGSGA